MLPIAVATLTIVLTVNLPVSVSQHEVVIVNAQPTPTPAVIPTPTSTPSGSKTVKIATRVDAVVFDAQIFLYYAAYSGKGKVQVVGSIFRKESYAIALPNGSPYRNPINNVLLSLQEQGTYQEIYDKWFGNK